MLGIPGNVAVSGHLGTGSCLAPLQWNPTTPRSFQNLDLWIPTGLKFLNGGPVYLQNLQESPGTLKNLTQHLKEITQTSPDRVLTPTPSDPLSYFKRDVLTAAGGDLGLLGFGGRLWRCEGQTAERPGDPSHRIMAWRAGRHWSGLAHCQS